MSYKPFTFYMDKLIQLLRYRTGVKIVALSFLVFSFKSNNDIHFIGDKNLKTFDQIRKLPELRDKVVYIDVWGTRCIPCIEEFEFSKPLKETFQYEPVEYLYVAVDYGYPDDEQRWRKMAKDKDLTGYHILASKELYMDIWKTIKDSVETMYLIPHYIILNKEGNISYADAERPGSKERLYRQLRSVLAR